MSKPSLGELDDSGVGNGSDGHTRIWAKLPKMRTLEPNKMPGKKTCSRSR